MSIVLNDNVMTNAPKPSDARYYNWLAQWSSVAEANAWIPISQRYEWLKVRIAGVDYIYKGDVYDVNLIKDGSDIFRRFDTVAQLPATGAYDYEVVYVRPRSFYVWDASAVAWKIMSNRYFWNYADMQADTWGTGEIITLASWDQYAGVYRRNNSTAERNRISTVWKDPVQYATDLDSLLWVEVGETRRVLLNADDSPNGYNYRYNGSVWIQEWVAIPGALTTYLWTWNASTNTPTIVAWTGTAWDWYKVSVAWTTDIDGIAVRWVGDYIWFDWDSMTRQKIDNQTPVDYQAQIDDLYAFAVAMWASL